MLSIKNKLEDIRLQLGFRFQKEFAAFLGMNYTHYNRIANNTMQPEYEVMLDICNKLRERLPDIKVEEIFYKVVE